MTLARAIYDAKRFITAGGFEVDLALTPPGGYPITVKGIAMKHHNSISTDGLPINSENSHISIIESSLVEEGFITRDAAGKVNLRNYIVEYCDATGIERKSIIKETMPDETLGLIVCILGNYGS